VGGGWGGVWWGMEKEKKDEAHNVSLFPKGRKSKLPKKEKKEREFPLILFMFDKGGGRGTAPEHCPPSAESSEE